MHAFLAGETARTVVLAGWPGIGKTTLWEAAVEAARQHGLRVLSARPSDAEARLVFGALLVLTGLKMLVRHDERPHPEKSRALRLLRRLLPFTDNFDGAKMLTRIDGKRVLTPLFLALLLIEASDAVFAVDSILAILACRLALRASNSSSRASDASRLNRSAFRTRARRTAFSKKRRCCSGYPADAIRRSSASSSPAESES